jgi:hypothetical protein
MNPIFRNACLNRYARKFLFVAALFLAVVAGAARSSFAQCCSWGWGWQPTCCYRPLCCQPVCACQPICGCQPSCCPSSCCSGCAAPACGTSPCGPTGCGVSYRVGPATDVVRSVLNSQEVARRGLPRTMTRVVFEPASRANDQTVSVFHLPTRPNNPFVLRRDFGAVESRVSSTGDRLPLSLNDGIDRY